MTTATELVDHIRDCRHTEALRVLNEFPSLATGRSDEVGLWNGSTPLHWAALRNAVDLCQRLIELGARVDARGSSWWQTPLSWAADAGSAEAVELLLQHGADVNGDAFEGSTALHAVAIGGSYCGVEPKRYGRTAEILIAHGADVNRLGGSDHYRRTPLFDAIRSNNAAVVNVLRKHGGEPSGPSSCR